MNRTADQSQANPLREGLSTRAVPQPCAIVIFGATGDLTHRKLVPALYNLAADGEIAARRRRDRFCATSKEGRRISHRNGGSDPEIFAATGPGRDLENFCPVPFLSSKRIRRR